MMEDKNCLSVVLATFFGIDVDEVPCFEEVKYEY